MFYNMHINSSGGVRRRGALPKSPSRSARSRAPAQPQQVLKGPHQLE